MKNLLTLAIVILSSLNLSASENLICQPWLQAEINDSIPNWCIESPNINCGMSVELYSNGMQEFVKLSGGCSTNGTTGAGFWRIYTCDGVLVEACTSFSFSFGCTVGSGDLNWNLNFVEELWNCTQPLPDCDIDNCSKVLDLEVCQNVTSQGECIDFGNAIATGDVVNALLYLHDLEESLKPTFNWFSPSGQLVFTYTATNWSATSGIDYFYTFLTVQEEGVWTIDLLLSDMSGITDYCQSIFFTVVGQQIHPCICQDYIDEDAICPAVFDPVCGCNGVTYSNSCVAENAGVQSYLQGECGSTTGTTIWSACDDGNPNTINDVLNGNCQCAGVQLDCSNAQTIVRACDDGDPCTFDDQETVIEATLEVCIPCAGTFDDCSFGNTVVLPCDDGNDATINDVVMVLACDQSFVCTPCTGEVVDDCICPDYIDPTIICTAIFDPVCGCNGITYSNECEAFKAGVSSYQPGDCSTASGPQQAMSCNDGDPSTENDTIQDDCSCVGTPVQDDCICPDYIDPTIICTAIFDPVCGCNGITYSNECEAFKAGVRSFQAGDCSTATGLQQAMSCNDGDPSTENDTIQDDCSCAGTPVQDDCICPDLIDPDLVCPTVFDPVCGCDGNTYFNECVALQSGVKSIRPGSCNSTSGAERSTFCNDMNDMTVNDMIVDCICQGEIINSINTEPRGIVVYPNPSTGILHVDSQEDIHGIILYDLRGKEVYRIGRETTSIDISSLPSGIYVLVANVSSGPVVTKVVKM